MKRKVLITCAVTGNAPFNPKHPNFPITPEQIAASAIEAAEAGASIVHLHVRDPETGEGSRDVNLFRETVARVRDYETDVVINLTAGMGAILLPDPEDESKALPESDVVGRVIAGPHAALEEITNEDWQTTLQVNVTGMFYTMKHAIPGMKERRFGSIINFSSPQKKPLILQA